MGDILKASFEESKGTRKCHKCHVLIYKNVLKANI